MDGRGLRYFVEAKVNIVVLHGGHYFALRPAIGKKSFPKEWGGETPSEEEIPVSQEGQGVTEITKVLRGGTGEIQSFALFEVARPRIVRSGGCFARAASAAGWAKIRPASKNTKLSHKSCGRLLMTFLYSPLAFSCKTRATRRRDVTRVQSVMDTASRYLCKTRLSQMKAQHINHRDLRALLQVPPLQAAIWNAKK